MARPYSPPIGTSWSDGAYDNDYSYSPIPVSESSVAPDVAPAAAFRSLDIIDAELTPIKAEIARIQRDEQKPLLIEIKAILAGNASLRGADEVNSLLEAVKAKITNLQKLQSPLLRERAAAPAAVPAAVPAAAPAAAPAASVPFTFNLVIPQTEHAKPKTFLYLIGPKGERHPSQKKWKEQWQSALTQVQALPREQYSPAFAQIKKQFEDAGCIFEKRPFVPRGDGPASGGRGGARA
jgi:hypothetical protein